MADYAVANPPYRLPTARLRTRVLDPVPQQHRTAFQGMAALQHHRGDGRALVGFGFRGIEDARRPLCTVHDRTKDQVEFVDQSRAQKRAIGAAPSFQKQALHAEFAIEDIQREGEVELRLSREDVGHAFAAQPRQVRVRDRLGKHDHDRIAADVRTAPADFAVGVEYHAVRVCIAPREPGLTGKALPRRCRVGCAFGELLTCDAADQPGVAGEVVVHALEEIPGRSLGPPAAGERSTVDARGHEADDMRFHAKLLILTYRRCVSYFSGLDPRLACQANSRRRSSLTTTLNYGFTPQLSSGERLIRRLVEFMKMMDRPVAMADAEAIRGRDRGADPGFCVAHGGFHVRALCESGRDGRG